MPRLEASTPHLWKGRPGGQTNELVNSKVKIIDPSSDFANLHENSTAIIGFACDTGISRNHGRRGAKLGPNALRSQLKNLCFSQIMEEPIYDLGTVCCDDENLESAQDALASLVEKAHDKNLRPIVLGGGHETAWGHFQGLIPKYKSKNIGIINFDAHLDLRPLKDNTYGTSGTPFRQMATYCHENHIDFKYLCIGLQKHCNPLSLFQTAKKFGTSIITADQFFSEDLAKIKNAVLEFCNQCDNIYLSICLDVFQAGCAPGVSAPQSLGLQPFHILPIYDQLLSLNKIVSLDVVELSPPFDQDLRTANLAAHLTMKQINANAHSHS